MFNQDERLVYQHDRMSIQPAVETPHQIEAAPVDEEEYVQVGNTHDLLLASNKLQITMGIEPEIHNWQQPSMGKPVPTRWHIPLAEEVMHSSRLFNYNDPMDCSADNDDYEAGLPGNMGLQVYEDAPIQVFNDNPIQIHEDAPVQITTDAEVDTTDEERIQKFKAFAAAAGIKCKDKEKRKTELSSHLERLMHSKNIVQKLNDGVPTVQTAFGPKDANQPIVTSDPVVNVKAAMVPKQTITARLASTVKHAEDKTMSQLKRKCEQLTTSDNVYGQPKSVVSGKEAEERAIIKGTSRSTSLEIGNIDQQLETTVQWSIQQDNPSKRSSGHSRHNSRTSKSKYTVMKDGEDNFEPPARHHSAPIEGTLAQGFQPSKGLPPSMRSHAFAPWTKLRLKHKTLIPQPAFLNIPFNTMEDHTADAHLCWLPRLPFQIATFLIHPSVLVEQTILKSATMRITTPTILLKGKKKPTFQTEIASHDTSARLIRLVLPPPLDGPSEYNTIHTDWLIAEFAYTPRQPLARMSRRRAPQASSSYLLIAFPTFTASPRVDDVEEDLDDEDADKTVKFVSDTKGRLPLVYGVGRDAEGFVGRWAEAFAMKEAALEVVFGGDQIQCWR